VAWPLRDRQGETQGVLALHDTQVRDFGEQDRSLLGAMADELASSLEDWVRAEQERIASARASLAGPSAAATAASAAATPTFPARAR
jgi:GAF domain-containing protein